MYTKMLYTFFEVADMFDIENLSELLKAFYTVTGVKIVVIDSLFNEIAAYPETDCAFCTKAKTLSGNPCRISEVEFCKKSRSLKNLYTGRCHAGLWESVFPIMDGSLLRGYIMFGQIAKKGDIPKRDYNPYCLEFADTPRKKTTEEIKAYTVILRALSSYAITADSKETSPKEPGLAVADYIANNLSENLSIEALCTHFSMSRSKLYKETTPYMPGGIGTYIKNQRLAKAKRLLAETDLSIREISRRTGYCDNNYFSRDFKKCTGFSPAKYRTRSKKEQ